MRAFAVGCILVAFLLPACGGGGSSPSAPTAQTLQGTWRATKAEFVSGSTRMDVVAQGATVTLAFSGNSYTFTMTTSGQAPEVQTGTWSASSEVMTLVRTGSGGNQQFDMTFSGNNLTLNNGSAWFDFNTGNFVDAKLSMTLVRQ